LDHKDLGLFGKDPAAILHIVPGHFVIPGSYLNNRLIIYDAATGIVSTESAGFLEKWSGRTVLISRNEIKLPTSSPKPILRW
jgi:ABC-type bacteriocin/lantibiotic exporter with double-glycine peptidase domain